MTAVFNLKIWRKYRAFLSGNVEQLKSCYSIVYFWNERQFLVNHKQNPISNLIIIILVMPLKSLFWTVHNVPFITRLNKIRKLGASPSVIYGNKIQSNFTKELIIVAVISYKFREKIEPFFLWIDMRRVNLTTKTPLSGTISITGPLYSRLEPRY